MGVWGCPFDTAVPQRWSSPGSGRHGHLGDGGKWHFSSGRPEKSARGRSRGGQGRAARVRRSGRRRHQLRECPTLIHLHRCSARHWPPRHPHSTLPAAALTPPPRPPRPRAGEQQESRISTKRPHRHRDGTSVRCGPWVDHRRTEGAQLPVVWELCRFCDIKTGPG